MADATGFTLTEEDVFRNEETRAVKPRSEVRFEPSAVQLDATSDVGATHGLLLDEGTSGADRQAILDDLHAERSRLMRAKRLDGLSPNDELYLTGLLREIDVIESHATRERRRHEGRRNEELANIVNRLIGIQAAIEANKTR